MPGASGTPHTSPGERGAIMARISEVARGEIRPHVQALAARWRERRAFGLGESLNETEAKIREWFERHVANGVAVERCAEVLDARIESTVSGVWMYTRELLSNLIPTPESLRETVCVGDSEELEQEALMMQLEPLWSALRRSDPEAARRVWATLDAPARRWVTEHAGPRAQAWFRKWELV